ncbi:MAG: potassium channel family protein [Thermoanaerobaculales bacterium]
MDPKVAGLIGVFSAYVASIPLFGVAYYVAYRLRRSNFVFAAEIYSSRLADEKRRADDRLLWLSQLLDYFQVFRTEHRQGLGAAEPRNDELALQLGDGRWFVLERHTFHTPPGGESESAPFVRLMSAEGAERGAGGVVGHGFLSEFDDWRDYVVVVVPALEADLRDAQEKRQALDSTAPQVWRYLDFLYFSAITQSTVGYGDILPNSTPLRLIVVAQIVLGYALLIVLLNLILSG